MMRPRINNLVASKISRSVTSSTSISSTLSPKSHQITLTSPSTNLPSSPHQLSPRCFSTDHKAYQGTINLSPEDKTSEMNALLAVSPVDGRYYSNTKSLSPYFSEYALIKNRLIVEIRWLQHLAGSPQISSFPELSPEEKFDLELIITNFTPEEALSVKQIEKKTRHDLKAVEYYIKNKIADDSPLQKRLEFLHFACTSEDINNLAYALMVKEAREKIILPKMTDLILALCGEAEKHAGQPMLALTHGQPASPTTVGKEFANFAARLVHQRVAVEAVKVKGKLNGAVGNFNAHLAAFPSADWSMISQTFVEDRLGLSWSKYSSQIEFHDYIAEMFDAVIRFNNIVLDFDCDMWGYISRDYFKLATVKNEVGSSTMPHKVNPIDFENSEGNIGLANATLSHLSSKLMKSRFQRDLSDSTALRNMGVGLAHSLIAYDSALRGLSKISPNTAVLHRTLERSWQVLGEPIQTVLRVHNVPGAYEMLKELTRGTEVDATSVRSFVERLEIPEEDKQRLRELTPESYIGLAKEQALDVRRYVHDKLPKHPELTMNIK